MQIANCLKDRRLFVVLICFSAAYFGVTANFLVIVVSGDKTCKVWDVAGKALLHDFPMGTTTDDMQVGCLWQGNAIALILLTKSFMIRLID